MMTSTRLRDRIYSGAVLALLLLMSMLNGYVSAAIAVVLLLVGLLLFPDMRRTGILVAILGAGVAALVVLLRPIL